MVKRPHVEQALTRSRANRRRRRSSTGDDNISETSGDGESLHQQNDQDSREYGALPDLSSPEAHSHPPEEEDFGELDDNVPINNSPLAYDTLPNDGDASDGSSEGSSIEDPDDELTALSPRQTSKDLADLKEVLNEEEDDSDLSDNDIETGFGDRDPPLYYAAPITLNESMLSILTLAFTHNLSRSCLDDVLQLVSIHCPSSNVCKDNIRLFRKHFNKSKSLVVKHYYCTTCFETLPGRDKICIRCNEHRGVAFFVEVPILPQLEALYGREGFKNLLMHRFKRSKLGVNTYDDIYDGNIYKTLSARGNILSDANNISFCWHTDGIKLTAASDSELWPFYLTINELPFQERTKPENVLLAGIWFGARKPVPHLFLKGIREDFHSLNKGVQFKVPGASEPVLVRGIVICGVCDLTAKALFLNMSHPSSTFGCQRCKVRSVKEQNQAVYKFQRYPPKRTYQETLLHAEKALKARRSVYGVKGTSALSFVYRPVETTAIDMHDAYIGVSKVLNKVHFSEDHYKHPASLFGFLQLYDRRLCAIKPPYYVEKVPRSYAGFGKEWSPSELKVNLMIYSLPLLQDIMSVFHFEHHMLLVYGLYLLSKDSVTDQDILLASEMLTDYCSRFEDLYGNSFMTSHVHQLIHLPDVVKDFGPLWVTSCAPYHTLNETLRKFSQGSSQEETQVTSAASLFLHVSKLKPVQPGVERPAHKFCEKLSKSGKKLEVHSMYGHFCIVGKLKQCDALPEVTFLALGPLKQSGQKYCVFERILNTRKNILFSSENYDQGSKNISSCVKYQKNNGAFFGKVHSYLRVTECSCEDICRDCDPTLYAIIQKLHTQPAYRAEPGGFIPFIHRCAEMNEYEAVRVECLSYVCFMIEIEDRHDAFVVEPITTGRIE
ncbi:Leucine--tRNA ligase [Frankliniella fusca]|uniref:Leucine--tRNA ligase n=1 Tax=Frankliniella fusca TaxID=407009 RepID=A0AAE1L7U6_9NEOP|nr:Leucine--tRNA ligase [Frankliniella fusca]